MGKVFESYGVPEGVPLTAEETKARDLKKYEAALRGGIPHDAAFGALTLEERRAVAESIGIKWER